MKSLVGTGRADGVVHGMRLGSGEGECSRRDACSGGVHCRQPYGTLAQVMRGIPFPNSNIIFDTQTNDPGAPPKKRPIR